MQEDRTPAVDRQAFYCPSCAVFAAQAWSNAWDDLEGRGLNTVALVRIAMCASCSLRSFWLDGVLLWPLAQQGELPHNDMPADIRKVYDEARSVAPISAKSAAGLLRLGLQMLVDELEPGSANINDKIGALVKRGLDPLVQQAMDVLRVVGNESVHPGQIDMEEDPDLLPGLFNLTNVIVEQVVARPKHIGGLFAKLPATKLDAIQKRDT